MSSSGSPLNGTSGHRWTPPCHSAPFVLSSTPPFWLLFLLFLLLGSPSSNLSPRGNLTGRSRCHYAGWIWRGTDEGWWLLWTRFSFLFLRFFFLLLFLLLSCCDGYARVTCHHYTRDLLHQWHFLCQKLWQICLSLCCDSWKRLSDNGKPKRQGFLFKESRDAWISGPCHLGKVLKKKKERKKERNQLLESAEKQTDFLVTKKNKTPVTTNTTWEDPSNACEIVVFQDSQVLPLFVIEALWGKWIDLLPFFSFLFFSSSSFSSQFPEGLWPDLHL